MAVQLAVRAAARLFFAVEAATVWDVLTSWGSAWSLWQVVAAASPVPVWGSLLTSASGSGGPTAGSAWISGGPRLGGCWAAVAAAPVQDAADPRVRRGCVAKGQVGLALVVNGKSWDHAVGVICVQEAGGQTSDWSGKPLDLAADLTSRRIIYPSGGVLVTNGVLHDKLVEMISANYN
ncbi:unnamed protein product [Miscanthus lutarioriparius]|uniref:Uncharacterized protein n=1 Tax=Miscanthus lutarioriparius TaxID=422564 RepID=A0A811N7H6_9POAL|nr:unnamed protein product [Miscanthus lutarioriparius]